jgi:RNA polymerase-associated protein RTF1
MRNSLRLNELPEMKREEILAQRQEEMQLLTDKLNLTKFLATQRELGGTGGMADDSVAQAAKSASSINSTSFSFLLGC